MSAKDDIKQFDQLEKRDSNFMNLYRDTADYVYPLENAIRTRRTNGENKMAHLLDTTAVFAADEFVSGLSSVLMPPGQPFFAVESNDSDANEMDEHKQYLQGLSNAAHELMFSSNFPMMHDEFLKSWGVWGDAGISAEPGEAGDDGVVSDINFMDYLPGHYHYQENGKGVIDCFWERFEYTAKQAFDEWGNDAGPAVLKDMENDLMVNNLHEFIHVLRPRKDRDPNRIDVMNMPFEDLYISLKDQKYVKQGGQPEFKVHISRWEKARRESRGRGIGVKIMPKARAVNAMYRDLIECGNRHNNPAITVNGDFDGDYDNSPGAVNWGSQNTSIGVPQTQGNFPITREMYEMERDEIRGAFMIDVFNQLVNLKGDRRTTLEISERLNEGLRRLSKPIGRLIYEELSPLIRRVILIMIREFMVPPPPPGLQGRGIKITFLSPLVLALKRHQANGFMEWAAFVGEMEAVFPGVKDNIDADQAVRDMADAFGVKSTHKMPLDKRDAIREGRAAQAAQRQAMEAAQMAGDAYAKTTKAPEEGSAAGAVMNA